MKDKDNKKPSLKEIKAKAEIRLNKYKEENKDICNRGKVMELDR
ncbi:hypothetical protein [Clostridium sp. VAP23]|nr:hypothetical protein [Clostridium sp. VAP23]